MYDKGRIMKKIKKSASYSTDAHLSKINEAAPSYTKVVKNISLKEFTYEDFKKVAEKIPFIGANKWLSFA